MQELNSQRFGTFFDRVKVERSALRLVNTKDWNTPKLHGLTTAAIDAWFKGAVEVNAKRKHQLEAIAALLSRLSARIDALADKSRTVFANDHFPTLPTDDLLDELGSVIGT